MAALYEDALVYETGSAITSTGAMTAYSGAKTGRSPLDKRIVKEDSSERDIWWGPVNKPMTPEVSFIFAHVTGVFLQLSRHLPAQTVLLPSLTRYDPISRFVFLGAIS